MTLITLLGLGLLLGVRHAADADHVVAVAAITARTRRVLGAAWLGMLWGLGHTLTIFVVGAAIIVFDIAVPPRVGLSFEFAVALALIVVGLLNFNRPHRHDERLAVSTRASERIPALRAFGVGLVHGLAGSAAVALLVLATVRDARWACGYLVVFGVGTMLGMAIITVGMASPLALASQRWQSFGRWTRLATGSLSLLLGLWLVYQIGWRDGLFTSTPRWSPH